MKLFSERPGPGRGNSHEKKKKKGGGTWESQPGGEKKTIEGDRSSLE